jgi:hypothetical protein
MSRLSGKHGPAPQDTEFSSDFCDDIARPVFPDVGLSLLDAEPGVTYEFIREYRDPYLPDQLANYEVLISLKPRIR